MKSQRIPDDSVIVRQLEWREDENGLVTVLRPCLGKSGIGKRIAEAFRFDAYRIRLDRIGSAVWKLSDGKNSVETIKVQIEKLFPDEEQMALAERLNAFLHQMNRSRMVVILGPEPHLE